MHFQELGLNDELLGALDDLKFTDPTPIQAQAMTPVGQAPKPAMNRDDSADRGPARD